MLKRKNILLVEPDYKNLYPPLGLMKIAAYHKEKGDNVDYVKGNAIKRKKYHIIYITTLFTYFAKEVIETIKFYKSFYANSTIKVGGIFASLMPSYIKENTGITPHVGLFNPAENYSPDYSLVPTFKSSITFTTRGCIRNCPYCAVKKHEPYFFVKENWEQDIDMNKSRIIFWDNNWLCSPNFYKDIEKLKKINKLFDFNQGIDARFFSDEKARLIASLKINPLRFAFDSVEDDMCVEQAIKRAQKNGIKDIRVYVLYNFKDSPEDFYYRINKLNKLGALSYPMKYRPIDSVDNHFISEKWDNKMLRALKLILVFYYTKGMIRRNIDAFKKIFGSSKKNFKNRLYEIYENDKKANNKGYKISFEFKDIKWKDII